MKDDEDREDNMAKGENGRDNYRRSTLSSTNAA